MRQLLASVMLAGLVVAVAAPAFAKPETLKGQLVDQVCYLKDKVNNKGVDHKMPADTNAAAFCQWRCSSPRTLRVCEPAR